MDRHPLRGWQAPRPEQPHAPHDAILDEQLALLLKQMAEHRQRPVPELIREALGEYAERRNPGTVRKLPGVGAYRSGRSDVSGRAEEWLGEAPERA